MDNTDSRSFESITKAPYTVIDAETTTHNKGHPFDPRNRLISYAYLTRDWPICFRYYTDPNFRGHIPASVVVGLNVKFDLHWLKHSLSPTIKIWDCQLAEHVYTGQKAPYISLNECLEKYGLGSKTDVVKELWDAGVQTDEIPIDILKEYNEWDVKQTEQLFLTQQILLNDEQKNLVYLMGEDLKVLAAIEQAGLLFDSENAAQALAKYKLDVIQIEEQLQGYLPPIQHGTFNWDSGDHLSCLLYGGTLEFDWCTSEPAVYKSGEKKGQEYVKHAWFTEEVVFAGYYKPLEGTETKKTKDNAAAKTRYYQTDVPTLSSLKGGGVKGKQLLSHLNLRSEKQKVVEMLESIFKQFADKQWENNIVHGTYNQNVAITGRLSSTAPNMQNQPPEVEQFFISRYD